MSDEKPAAANPLAQLSSCDLDRAAMACLLESAQHSNEHGRAIIRGMWPLVAMWAACGLMIGVNLVPEGADRIATALGFALGAAAMIDAWRARRHTDRIRARRPDWKHFDAINDERARRIRAGASVQ